MATAIKCTVCGGMTGVRADAVHHRCEFCGAEFYWEATHRAAGEIERRVRAVLDEIQPQLDALDAAAKHAAAHGDVDGAYRHVADHVRHVGAIYEREGYYRLMGVDTPEAIERNQRGAYALHLQRLGFVAAVAPQANTPYARMVEGTSTMRFDLALDGYKGVIAEQLANDPQWRHRDAAELEQVKRSAIRTFALGLWFATPDDFKRHGIECPTATRRADGSAAVTCVQCGAEVVLAQHAETITCPHCNATFRIRLDGLAAYHAYGYTDVTQADVDGQQQANAIAMNGAGAIDARIEMARGIVAGMQARDATHTNEYTFVYALELGAPLSPAEQQTIATKLGLGAPTACRKCEKTIAIGAGTTVCPMCTSRL